MKLVLSRKGFDSSAGGCPSPILPDGQLLSLPIPDKNSTVAYQDIRHNGTSIGPMVEQLTNGRIPASHRAHLDPDLVGERLPRRRGWRPLFGQTNQAQVHLRNNGVGKGDLFLFFGLFRRTVMDGKQLVWDRRSRPVHVLWGWMQVDRVHALGMGDSYPHLWAQEHPHLHRADDPHNTLYTGRSKIDLGHKPCQGIPGAGVFPYYKPSLQLTADGAHRATEWDLPR